MKKFLLINLLTTYIFINLTSSVSYAKDQTLVLSGDILQIAIPTAAFTLTVLNRDDEGSKEFFVSFLATTGITHLIKCTTGKTKIGKRPNGGSRSFPSGHTSSAFQGAFFMQHRYGPVFGVPAAALAAFTGYTRVRGKYHHVRDVVAGTAISYAVSYFAVSKFNPENTKINAIYSKDTVGVKLEFKL